MKDYNQEYFYIRGKGINFPEINYVNWPDSNIDFLETSFKEDRVIPFKYDEPIPDKPQLGNMHFCAFKAIGSVIIKNTLTGFDLKNIQFIPATIYNLAEEIVKDYYIIHIYNLIECMDKEKSDWVSDRREPDLVQSIDRLILDNEKLDKIPLEDRLVFALKEHPLTTVYHRSVIDKILALQPTGVGVYCLADWDGSNPFEDEFWEYVMS